MVKADGSPVTVLREQAVRRRERRVGHALTARPRPAVVERRERVAPAEDGVALAPGRAYAFRSETRERRPGSGLAPTQFRIDFASSRPQPDISVMECYSVGTESWQCKT